MEQLLAGVYRHYKGPLYLVLGYGHDSNQDGRQVIIYIGLELDQAKPGPRLCVRTVSDFFTTVQVDGVETPRFTYISPEWIPE